MFKQISKKKKEIIDELKKMEKEKDDDIKNMKENNIKLEQQKNNLILMLNNLKSRFDYPFIYLVFNDNNSYYSC